MLVVVVTRVSVELCLCSEPILSVVASGWIVSTLWTYIQRYCSHPLDRVSSVELPTAVHLVSVGLYLLNGLQCCYP